MGGSGGLTGELVSWQRAGGPIQPGLAGCGCQPTCLAGPGQRAQALQPTRAKPGHGPLTGSGRPGPFDIPKNNL